MAMLTIFLNQKGGVGKSTVSASVAMALSQMGYRVLFIDMDKSGNGTKLFGQERITNSEDPKSIEQTIKFRGTVDELIIRTSFGVDVVRSSKHLEDLNEWFNLKNNSTRRFSFFKQFVDTERVHNDYDVVIIDTKPKVDDIIRAIINACHYYVIPLFADAFSADGLKDQINICEDVKRDLDSDIKFLGAVINAYRSDDPNHVAFQNAIRNIGKDANFKVLKSVIPYSRAAGTASRNGCPISVGGGHLPIWKSIQAVAREISVHLKNTKRGRKPQPVNTDLLQNLSDFNSACDLEPSPEL